MPSKESYPVYTGKLGKSGNGPPHIVSSEGKVIYIKTANFYGQENQVLASFLNQELRALKRKTHTTKALTIYFEPLKNFSPGKEYCCLIIGNHGLVFLTTAFILEKPKAR